MHASEFTAWVGARTDAAAAAWLNDRLGTRYRHELIYKWRSGRRPVPARVVAAILRSRRQTPRGA